MIAKIAVNNNAKQTDRLFDYEVPLKMDVHVGNRVFVPFGAGNKLFDGYVMYTAARSKYQKLKQIDSIAEEKPYFDENAVRLIEYMRENYFCTYNDAVHVMIPSGAAVKPCEWIVLKDKSALTPKENKIAEMIERYGGEMEINALMSCFDTSITASLGRMRKKRAVESEFRDRARVSDKTVRVVSMCEEADKEILKKCTPKQKRVIEILSYSDYISVSDLARFSETSYSVISALVKKGIVYIHEIEVMRSPLKERERTAPPELTEEQKAVTARLFSELEENKFSEELLFGVTGSGKTEVYMRAIEHTVGMGRKAVMLVPEISLTPQTVARFQSRFGDRIAVFHSALSMGERYDEWKRMRDGMADIVIGARSAVFCPLDNIGIIIIDEQHERTYKSETSPRYITSEIARFRAKQNNAVLLQASATPSVTDYYRASTGECGLLKMTKRAGNAVMPEVEVIDMCAELSGGNRTVIGKRLTEEIKKNIENKEQTVLLLNRRGYSTFVSCRSCGYVMQCPNCSISLTYHKFTDSLHCHYCGYSTETPKVCPSCRSTYIRYFGGGTQKVEEDIKKQFPEASVIRMDVDTTSGKGGHERLLERFRNEKADILIGTQMIAKGLDFPDVTLAGVVTADTVLNIDEYTSSERAFALLEQVSGRAGRAAKRGRAIVQTYTPEHDAIVKMKNHDYEGFYKNEIKLRRAMWYPPFCDMLSVLVSGGDEKTTLKAARFFKKQLAPIETVCGKYQILGPIPDYISKIKNKYRFKMIIKCDSVKNINMLIADALRECGKNSIYSKVTFVINRE